MQTGAAPPDDLRPAEEVTLAGSAGPMRVHLHRPGGTPRGTAIIAHGRNGAADAPHMVPLIAAAVARGLTVIAPDLCHSAHNLSAGTAETFTMADHYADLATVADYAVDAAPGGAARILVGHSMGGYAVVRLAADGHRWGPTGVVAVSPVISGAALIAAREAQGPEAVAMLRRELPRALDEWPAHDALAVAGAVRAPSAVIVGVDDTVTPPAHAAALAAALGRCVWHDVVMGEHHCPLGPGYAASTGTAFDRILEAG